MEPGLSDQDDWVASSNRPAVIRPPQWSLVFPTRMTVVAVDCSSPGELAAMEPGLSDQDDLHQVGAGSSGESWPQWSLVFPTRMTGDTARILIAARAAMEPGLSDQDDRRTRSLRLLVKVAAMEPGLSDQDDPRGRWRSACRRGCRNGAWSFRPG